MLHLEEKKQFLSTPFTSSFNPYITRHFYRFLFEMTKLIKVSLSDNYYKVESNKSLTSKLNIVNYMEDILIINQLILYLKHVNDLFKSTTTSDKSNQKVTTPKIELLPEEIYAYKDSIMYGLNILNELITPIPGT